MDYYNVKKSLCSCHQVTGSVWRLRCGLVGPGIESQSEVIVFSKTSRPALGPVQPPVEWVPDFFPRGGGEAGNWPECDVTSHLHRSVEEKIVCSGRLST